MDFAFKRRHGEFKKTGDRNAFSTYIDELRRAGASSSSSSSSSSSPSGPPLTLSAAGDKVVFYGYGRDISAVLNEYHFVLVAPGSETLRLRVTWLPATKKGAGNIAKAAAKGAAKKGAKLGGKAAASALTHGATAAGDVADGVKAVGKAAIKAARGEIDTAVENLNQQWEARITLSQGPEDIADTIGPVHRSCSLGGECVSEELNQQFLRMVGAYVVSVGNMVAKATGETPYQRLYDQEEVAQAALEAEDKKNQSKVSKLQKVYNWFKEKRSHKGFQELKDEDD